MLSLERGRPWHPAIERDVITEAKKEKVWVTENMNMGVFEVDVHTGRDL